MKIQVNDYVVTPRFGRVQISQIFNSQQEAAEEGFIEPSHYSFRNDAETDVDVLGKYIDDEITGGSCWIRFEWAAVQTD